MPPDVSVLIPAYHAIPLIQHAVQSVLAQQHVDTEIIIAADDDLDYPAYLATCGIDSGRYTFCRTTEPRRGPAVARNLAASVASGPILAPLDADDTFGPNRLRGLLDAVDRVGVVTGPTVEHDPSGKRLRVAQPRLPSHTLSIDELCTLRMPFFPLFYRQFYGDGWPDFAFAEDLVFNVSLLNRVGTYPFVSDAEYHYLQHEGSISNAADSIDKAKQGYRQILEALDTGGLDWEPHLAKVLHTAISADLSAIETHLNHEDGVDTPEWRTIVRSPHHRSDGELA